MSLVVYPSHVMHQRLRPRPHRLEYSIFSFLIDLDTLAQDAAPLRLFSVNRFNLFSFFERDRGDSRRFGLAGYVREQLERAELLEPEMKIHLLTMPRVLGLAFNPLSVYFCARADGSLKAVLWEVDNTFGERHSYLIPAGEKTGEFISQTCTKAFYVSPFLPMGLTYRFRFSEPGKRLKLHITVQDAQGPLLFASQQGTRAAPDDRLLMKLFARLPVQSLWVLGAIHWEALKIWRKGMRLFSKPPPPESTVSRVLNNRNSP